MIDEPQSEDNGAVEACMPLSGWLLEPTPETTLFGVPATPENVVAFATRMGYVPNTGKGKPSMPCGGAIEVKIRGQVMMLYWDAA